MGEEATPYATGAATTPPGWDDAPVSPKRNGYRGMLPSTCRVEYADAAGESAQTSGVLLDWCPVGVVLSLSGAKTLIPWERLALLELVSD